MCLKYSTIVYLIRMFVILLRSRCYREIIENIAPVMMDNPTVCM